MVGAKSIFIRIFQKLNLIVGALLWTLKKGLDKDWTKDVEDARVACYTILADTMINASSVENTIR